MKKRIGILLLVLVLVFSLAACGGSKETTDKSEEAGEELAADSEEPAADEKPAADPEGSVYYLNFKPEQDDQWQELAELYTEETGVPVTILTAASGQYETTLKSEMAKSNAPTLFQVNGPVGLAAWNEYCYDLSDTAIAGELSNDSFALMDGDSMAGVGYVIETYGLIYNKALLEEAGYTAEDINNFDDLKTVAEDISAREDELGFAAFTSAGMDGSSDWRFKTHLANLPIYYEYQADGILNTDAIKGDYLDNYRQIWNLYINNSTTDPGLLSTKTGDDAVAEFVTESGVFYQNGTWAYNDVSELGDENLGMLPIYIGAEGEENQGLCTGTENYWCVSNKADQVDIDATLDFINWCVTSDVATKAICGGDGAMPSGGAGMGFVIPFKGNLDSENPLVNIANEYVDEGYLPVDWTFSTMPSEEWKNGVGSALTSYAADQSDENWQVVVDAFVDGWAAEVAATN
ncbi:MAG TPA: ABC transporter substrate-binding protein [Candidatus Eisenbacteria bacterium]|nr:ABC transporter substrate-binding protein [Candidatus Eisenbacteria bacterium]